MFCGILFVIVRQFQVYLQIRVQQSTFGKIEELTRLAQRRSREVEDIRRNLANDFHDETGNLLAVIRNQAEALQKRLANDDQVSLLVASIKAHCEELYNTSRDFIWSAHSDSDNPVKVFLFLREFGQDFFNQFDIEFSAHKIPEAEFGAFRLTKRAARDLIAIFKEAMTNAAKHSGASRVRLGIDIKGGRVRLVLKDNGSWKPADPFKPAQGLINIQRRSTRNGFTLNRYRESGNTVIELQVKTSTR